MQAQVHKMIEVVDANKNHKIEFDEFYKFASQATHHNLSTISEYWYQYSTKPIVREGLQSILFVLDQSPILFQLF
jgi:hypothetical protein